MRKFKIVPFSKYNDFIQESKLDSAYLSIEFLPGKYALEAFYDKNYPEKIFIPQESIEKMLDSVFGHKDMDAAP